VTIEVASVVVKVAVHFVASESSIRELKWEQRHKHQQVGIELGTAD
jgi:hypothetical protein